VKISFKIILQVEFEADLCCRTNNVAE